MLVYLILCDGRGCDQEVRMERPLEGAIVPDCWIRDPVHKPYQRQSHRCQRGKVKHFCPECSKKREGGQ